MHPFWISGRLPRVGIWKVNWLTYLGDWVAAIWGAAITGSDQALFRPLPLLPQGITPVLFNETSITEMVRGSEPAARNGGCGNAAYTIQTTERCFGKEQIS